MEVRVVANDALDSPHDQYDLECLHDRGDEAKDDLTSLQDQDDLESLHNRYDRDSLHDDAKDDLESLHSNGYGTVMGFPAEAAAAAAPP